MIAGLQVPADKHPEDAVLEAALALLPRQCGGLAP